MKIKMLKNGLKKDEIFFTSAYGEGRGIWCGLGPVFPGEVEVEFELTQLFMRWVDIVPADSNQAAIRLDGDGVVFTGVLEDIDEEGTGYLRLGESLLMFESLGEPMVLGTFVEVKASEARIYPVVL